MRSKQALTTHLLRVQFSGLYCLVSIWFSKMELPEESRDKKFGPELIWATQKSNVILSEEGIVPTVPAQLDVYWKELGADEWNKVNDSSDGVEEGYESSRDETLSVSSFNPMKEDLNRTFGSSLSLQSFSGRSSNRGSLYDEGRTSIASHAGIPRLSAEVLNDSASDRSPTTLSPSQPPRHPKAFSAEDESTIPSASVPVESGTSEGFC